MPRAAAAPQVTGQFASTLQAGSQGNHVLNPPSWSTGPTDWLSGSGRQACSIAALFWAACEPLAGSTVAGASRGCSDEPPGRRLEPRSRHPSASRAPRLRGGILCSMASHSPVAAGDAVIASTSTAATSERTGTLTPQPGSGVSRGPRAARPARRRSPPRAPPAARRRSRGTRAGARGRPRWWPCRSA